MKLLTLATFLIGTSVNAGTLFLEFTSNPAVLTNDPDGRAAALAEFQPETSGPTAIRIVLRTDDPTNIQYGAEFRNGTLLGRRNETDPQFVSATYSPNGRSPTIKWSETLFGSIYVRTDEFGNAEFGGDFAQDTPDIFFSANTLTGDGSARWGDATTIWFEAEGGNATVNFNPDLAPVPLPASALLLGFGLLSFQTFRRRQQ